MNPVVFKAPMDKITKVVTIAVVLLIVGLAIIPAMLDGFEDLFPMLIMIPAMVALGLAYAWAPRHYEIHRDRVVIVRRIGNVEIPRKDITSVTLPGKAAMAKTIRTFGVGGFFGYYGRFYNTTLGKMTWYATSRSTPVLLVTKDKKILLTPYDVPRFVRELGGADPIPNLSLKNNDTLS